MTREVVRDEVSKTGGDQGDEASKTREGPRDGLRKIREVRGDELETELKDMQTSG